MRPPTLRWTHFIALGAALAAAGAIAWLSSLAEAARARSGPIDGTQEAFVALAAIGSLAAASLFALLSLRVDGPRWASVVLIAGLCLLWVVLASVAQAR
ncbi:MAG: hypothetical protein R3B09_00825 [Nannocystaceae bacterium]